MRSVQHTSRALSHRHEAALAHTPAHLLRLARARNVWPADASTAPSHAPPHRSSSQTHRDGPHGSPRARTSCLSPALQEALEPALCLGVALQLTNILRDVGEDRVRQRIYLPQEDLDRFGVTEQALLKGIKDEKYVAMLKFQIERAREWYATPPCLRPSPPPPPVVPSRHVACSPHPHHW